MNKTKVIYASLTSERDEKYRICTSIIEDQGKRFVRKEALNNAAGKHVDNISKNAEVLKNTYRNCKLFEIARIRKTGDGFIEYDYQDGPSLEKWLSDNDDHDLLIRKSEELWNELLKCDLVDNRHNRKYIDVFGESLADRADLHWSTDQDLDLSFANLFIRKNKYVISDYEWVYAFPVPLEFIYFRAVYYSNAIKNKEDLYRIAGIREEEIADYIATEMCFQHYVHGNTASLWDSYDRFSKDFENWKISELKDQERSEREENKRLGSQIKARNREIEKRNRELEDKKSRIEEINRQLEDQGRDIAEKERLIREKDIDLSNKNNQIDQLMYTYRELQQIKESMFVKAMYAWYRFRDAVLPKGSRRRLLVRLLADLIRHPIRTLSKLSIQRIGKFFVYLFKGDVYHISDKMNDLTATDAEKMKLDVSLKKNYHKLVFNRFAKPLVSIVIPVYNQLDYTYRCLESVLKYSGDIAYEVVIGDDNSNQRIDEYVENVKIIRNKENLGFLKNCNKAAEKAKGKYIMFLNNDTQVQDKWLSNLLELIESDDSIGMVGSKLVYPDGTLQEAGGIIWKDGSGWNYGRNKSPLDSEYNYVKDVDYISGAAIMIRKDLWKKIGGFDERYAPAYYEDTDLAFSVRKEGYRVVYQPLSVVVHFEGISNGKDENSGLKHYQVVNRDKFIEKWKAELDKQYPSEAYLFKARERNFDQKTVVFIDHYVPQYDRDAGSKSSIGYMKLFLNRGYIVKLIPDNFYKDEPYTTQFEQMGIEVLYGNWYANHIFDWLMQNKDNIDYIFANRPHITIKYIDLIKDNTKIKLMYYGHDLHFLRTQREYELNKDPQLLKDSKDWKEKEMHIITKADMSYYPSEVEAGILKGIDPGLRAKAIPLYIYDEVREDINTDFINRNGMLFVGGFRHTPNLDAVMWLLNEIYPKVSDKTGPIYIVGSNAPDDLLKYASDKVIIKGYVSEEELQELYDSCRIVVAPLRYGAGIKGKILEAMYNGVPTVTTSIGAEGISDSQDVLFVKDEAKDIISTIISIYNDPVLLKQRSAESIDYIKKHFSADNAWNTIKDDFK